MKTLEDIINNWGYIDSNQLTSLAEDMPKLPVIIKWGGMPREQIAASLAKARIAQVEEDDTDYCREVFLCTRTIDDIRDSHLVPNFIKLAIDKLRAR